MKNKSFKLNKNLSKQSNVAKKMLSFIFPRKKLSRAVNIKEKKGTKSNRAANADKPFAESLTEPEQYPQPYHVKGQVC